MAVGNRIREVRSTRSLSQTEPANCTGINKSYIPQLENGHIVPSLASLEKIGEALLIPIIQLFL
jgi:transcriptional regulator with XRE-family HTH domain